MEGKWEQVRVAPTGQRVRKTRGRQMTNREPESKLTSSSAKTLEHLRSLSHVLDNAIPIPGTSYRIGIDPILGLIPAAGDYVGTALSGYIVLQAARVGVPRATLSRMVFNIILETLVGTVPVLGDLFDAGWKANAKNLALLEVHAASPQERRRADWWFMGLLLGGLLLVVIGITVVGVTILRLLLANISG